MKNNKSILIMKLGKKYAVKFNKSKTKNNNDLLNNKSNRVILNPHYNHNSYNANNLKTKFSSNKESFSKNTCRKINKRPYLTNLINKINNRLKKANNSTNKNIKNKINKNGIYKNIFTKNILNLENLNKNARNSKFPKIARTFTSNNYDNNSKMNEIFKNNCGFFQKINTKIIDNNFYYKINSQNSNENNNYDNKTIPIEINRNNKMNNNILPFKTIYINRNNNNIKKNKNDNFKRTFNNFYPSKNKRNNYLLENSNSMRKYKENSINLLPENLHKNEENNQKNKMINNNMTINIDNIQNNYIQNKDNKDLEYNKYDNNSYNEKLFLKYKFKIVEEFIKYMNKYILLYLKKYKLLFLNTINNENNFKFKNEQYLFLKGLHKNISHHNYFKPKYIIKKHNLTDKLSDKGPNNSLIIKKDNCFLHTYANTFRNKCYAHKKIKLKIDCDMNNNFGQKISKNIILSDEENSKKLSISISSNEFVDINTNKSANNNSMQKKNYTSNKSNKLTLKLKDNKKNAFCIELNNNRLKLNRQNNNSFNNKKVNNIYVKKKNNNESSLYINTKKNKENQSSNNNSLIYIKNICLKNRNINNFDSLNNLKEKSDYLKKQISEEKQNKYIKTQYAYKKVINKNGKNQFSKEKTNKEINFQKINRQIVSTKDKKLYISLNSINFQSIDSQRYNKNIIYENKNLNISKLSLNIIKNIIFYTQNKKKDKVYHHIRTNNSFILRKEKIKQREEGNCQKNNSKIDAKKINNNSININNGLCNRQINLEDYNNIVINCKNNKYLKGCVNFLIKAIKRLLFNIFIYLKFYGKYYKLKNIVNKINNKKVEKLFFILFMKKIKENKNQKNKENKKNKKIIFNPITSRYELFNS